MALVNPIVNGRHISSLSGGAGPVGVSASPMPVSATQAYGSYHVPFFALILVAILVLILARAAGFGLIAAVKVGR